MYEACSIMLLQISIGSRFFTLERMSTTVWLLRSSHTPSEAMIRATSSSVMSYSVISGSAMTPTVAAWWSPIERAMANPRKLCHTREGEPLAPAGVMWPPICKIRRISSGESGFWSRVRSMALSAVDLGFWRAMMARESPEFASQRWLPRMRQATAVVPLTDASTASASVRSTSTKLSRSAVPGSLTIFSWLASSSGSCSMTYCDTCSPTRPWPSKTPKRPVALSSK
mmetsp:Transcript_23667/g.51728  ORF Transcript_23667/g.51728 Transcript_23667/m.51728 type:complete len:227 (-) Transcript_23667:563-1243(-)